MIHSDKTIQDIVKEGERLYSNGKPEKAKKLFRENLAKFPSDPTIKNNLGVIKYNEGTIISAKEYFLSALVDDEKHRDALSNLKILYEKRGSWDMFPQVLKDTKTITSFFEEAFKLDPKDPGIQNDMGIMQLYSGRIDEAEKCFRNSLNLDPRYQEAFYYLGRALLKKEHYVEANDNFITSMMLDPDSEIALKAYSEYQNQTTIGKIGTKYKKILIVMEEGIGNMVMLTPTITAIKIIHPSTSITVLSRKPSIEVIEGWNNVDRIITQPDEQSYDICMLTIWSGMFAQNFRPWMEKHCNQIFFCSLLKDQHESHSHFQIARCLGYSGEIPETYCNTADIELKLPKDRPVVALSDTTLNNGAWERKRWPYYRELCNKLINLGYIVVLIGGEYERKNFRKKGWPSKVINLMGRYSLPETASILKQCDIFIGNDSGPAHLAAAVGIPTFVIFGPTLISKNIPLGRNVKTLSLGLPCSPCQYTDRWNKCNDWQCMKQLTPEKVLKHVKGVSRRYSRGQTRKWKPTVRNGKNTDNRGSR